MFQRKPGVVRFGRTLGDLGRAEARLDQDVPALRTEGAGDSARESVDTGEERGAGINAKLELLARGVSINQRRGLRVSAYLVSEPELLAETSAGAELGRGAGGEAGRPGTGRGERALHCDGVLKKGGIKYK